MEEPDTWPYYDSTIITGQIETLVDTLPTLRPAGTTPRLETASEAELQPDSAVVGRPRENGRIGLVATGSANARSYTIPNGQPGLRKQLVAIFAENTVVGRVLVQDLTRADETLVNEPVNGETSLEGAVYLGTNVGHGPSRIPEGRTNPPQIALVHRFAEDVAGRAAADLAEIEALVQAFERAQEVLVGGFESMTGGYDSLAVNAGVRELAQDYAEARDAGAPAPEAHDTFVDGAVETYIDSAGTPAQVAIAWGAFATLHDAELAGRTAVTRLQSAQNLLHIGVTGRQALVATVPDGTAGKAEVSAALEDILAAGMAATEMASFVDAVAAQVEEGAAALQTARGADLSAELQAADLSAHIDTSLSPEEIAAGLPDYLSGVDAAAGDAELAALLIALMGGPGYGAG